MRIRPSYIALTLLLVGGLLLPATALAQQGKVLLADGRTVTIDIGADRELREGMEADIYRETPPIIHPRTQENLGRHKVVIARVRIIKVEANTSLASYVTRYATARTGDRVEGLELAPTYEEEIRSEVTEARAEIKALARSLADEIRTNQKEIAKIQSTLTRVATTEKRMNTLINSVMNMRERMVSIEGRLDSLTLQTTFIDSISEVQRLGTSDFRELGVLTRDEEEAIYIQVGERVFLLNLETEQLEDATAMGVAETMERGADEMAVEAGSDAAVSAEAPLFPEMEEEEETPFYIAYWWILPILGLVAGALLFVMKMLGGKSSAPEDIDVDEDGAFPEAEHHDDGDDGDDIEGMVDDEMELPEEIPALEEVETAEGEET